eukprot:scaffold2319_cov350-Pavlova_lutheri.AAC.7
MQYNTCTSRTARVWWAWTDGLVSTRTTPMARRGSPVSWYASAGDGKGEGSDPHHVNRIKKRGEGGGGTVKRASQNPPWEPWGARRAAGPSRTFETRRYRSETSAERPRGRDRP